MDARTVRGGSRPMHGRATPCTSLLGLHHLLGESKGRDPVPHPLLHATPLAWVSPPRSLTTSKPFTKPGRPYAPPHARLLSTPEDTHHRLLAQPQHALTLPCGEFLAGFLLRAAPTFANRVWLHGTCTPAGFAIASPTCHLRWKPSIADSSSIPCKRMPTSVRCACACAFPSSTSRKATSGERG